MQSRVGIAQDLVVDAACIGDFEQGIADGRHIVQELRTLAWCEVVQALNHGVRQQQRIAFEELVVSEDNPSGTDSTDHAGILVMAQFVTVNRLA